MFVLVSEENTMENKMRQVTDNIHGTIYLSALESEHHISIGYMIFIKVQQFI